ncbi:hypothetical protein AHAS_Ahas20G0028000 [Arachis hypogaea]
MTHEIGSRRQWIGWCGIGRTRGTEHMKGSDNAGSRVLLAVGCHRLHDRRMATVAQRRWKLAIV